MKRALAFLILLFLATPARAIPDNIWSHINTACTINQVPIKDSINSWSCGAPVASSVPASGIIGTISTTNLPSYVAYTTTTNTFTRTQTFSAGVSASTGVFTSTLSLTGVAGVIIAQSSITTSGAFFGDASHLTGIASGIAAASLDTTKLAPAAVDTTKLVNGAVTAAKLAPAAIDTSKLNTSGGGGGGHAILCDLWNGTIGHCANVASPDCGCN